MKALLIVAVVIVVAVLMAVAYTVGRGFTA